MPLFCPSKIDSTYNTGRQRMYHSNWDAISITLTAGDYTYVAHLLYHKLLEIRVLF